MPYKDPIVAHEKRLAHYQVNKEQLQKEARERYYANPCASNERNRHYRLAHREELLAYNRQYNKDHPEQVRASRAKRRSRIREQEKAWYLAHPGKMAEKNRFRKARQKGSQTNDLTHAQWLEIQAAQDHRCCYCHKRCKGHLTQDHITPLSEGGSHTLHNVIAACASCNSRKGKRKPPIPVQPLLLTLASARKKKVS